MNLIDPKIEAYAARHSMPESALFRQLVKENFFPAMKRLKKKFSGRVWE